LKEKGEMVKPEILMIGPMMPQVMTRLESSYQVHRYWEAADKAEFLAQCANVRGIATTGSLGASGEIISALPKLELICVYGVGVDAVDLAQAKTRGIPVTTTPDVLTADVADMALALLLAVSRNILPYDAYVRSGDWPNKGEPPLTRTLNGKRAGILGFGRVGKAVAKRLTAMDMTVSYLDPSPEPSMPYRTATTLVDLAKDSDVLIVTAAGGEKTRKLVNEKVLEALGNNGILINVSRGSIVDEDALVRALQNGKIAGAGLDVFANEPKVPEALTTMTNVVLQPHMASGTLETRTAMGELVIGNLEAHFAGQPLLTPYRY
jgi:hydroxypyruvate reductase